MRRVASAGLPASLPRATPHACRDGAALLHLCRVLTTGGRGDLFVRHVGAYKANAVGPQPGLTQTSQTTDPQTGQLQVRKRVEHVSHGRQSSGSGDHRAPIAAWSHLMPSLREGVEKALPQPIFDKLRTGTAALTAAEAQLLIDAQRLFCFELQRRIGLLEDSLADAALPYRLQWPTLFQRAWVRLPVAPGASSTAVAPHAGSVPTLPSDGLATSPRPLALLAPAPTAPPSGSLAARLEQLTGHVVPWVTEELEQLQRADAAPRSPRQAALEATWRAEWTAALAWHMDSA